MMKKKLFAFLTAACCFASGNMLVSAEENIIHEDFLTMGRSSEFIDNMRGGIVYHENYTSTCFFIVTDGTEITEEDVQEMEDYSNFRTLLWDEVAQVMYPDVNAEPDSIVYQVTFTSLKNMAETAKRFQLENEFVKEICFIRTHNYMDCVLGSGLEFVLADKSMILNPEDFPELTNLNDDTAIIDGITLEGEGNWHGRFTDEVMAECHADNAEGSYGSYLFMKEIADRVLQEHSDKFISVEPAIKSWDFAVSESFETQSIWQTAGDPNSDGTVDAQDAAALLETAAQAGTGAKITVTSAADVNADGAVGADDAAAVLTYAAANGSGNPLSWVEVLRK